MCASAHVCVCARVKLCIVVDVCTCAYNRPQAPFLFPPARTAITPADSDADVGATAVTQGGASVRHPQTTYDMRDAYGNTPLHVAAASGQAAACIFLLEEESDPNAQV